jgi:uncharacterized protein
LILAAFGCTTGLVLTATFQHAQGIGQTIEKRLWDSGILHWDDALATPSLPIPRARREILLPLLEQSRTALEENDFGFFARTLPQREHWRTAPHFMDRIGFLDIETNGGFEPDDITLIGVYDGMRAASTCRDATLRTSRRSSTGSRCG